MTSDAATGLRLLGESIYLAKTGLPPRRRGRIVRPPPPHRGVRSSRESGCVSPLSPPEGAGRGSRGRSYRSAHKYRSARGNVVELVAPYLLGNQRDLFH